MTSFLLLLVVVSSGAAYACLLSLRLRALKSASCAKLLESMHYVDMTEVCRIARGVQYHSGKLQDSREELLDRMGGLEGLQRLHNNAGKLLQIARFLTLMDPDAHVLAQKIRQDAFKVQRLVRIVYWQQRWRRIITASSSLSVPQLAEAYVALSVSSMRLCSRLVDQVLPLLQEANNVHSRMLRAHTSIDFDAAAS